MPSFKLDQAKAEKLYYHIASSANAIHSVGGRLDRDHIDALIPAQEAAALFADAKDPPISDLTAGIVAAGIAKSLRLAGIAARLVPKGSCNNNPVTARLAERDYLGLRLNALKDFAFGAPVHEPDTNRRKPTVFYRS